MLPPIHLPLVDGVLYIDNSSMELFTTCPRQAYYYVIRKLELNRSRIALDFGDRFHFLLETLYKRHGSSYRTGEDNANLLALAQQQILPTPEDDYRTTGYLVQAFETYLAQYPAERFDIAITPSGEPAIEIPFMFPLGTIQSGMFGPITVVWTGKIDMGYRSSGRLGIMDHKSTSMMGPQFFAEFEIAHQMYGYTAAAEHIFGEPVHEICINGLGCRKPTRTGKTFEFSRHIIPVNRDLLAEWHDDCLYAVKNFIQCAEEGYFPKFTKWCVSKYGPCQYRGVCTQSPQHRESTLATNEFRPVVWDPLNKTK